MSLPRLFALIPLVLALLAGCDASPPSAPSASGAMQLAIALPLAAPGDVARVTVTVSGADLAPLSTELSLTDGAWGGVLGDIPAGTGRTFLARAYTASSTLRYEGRADNVTVTAGATGLVSLLLQDLSPPPPLNNEAPIVDALVATPTSVTPGGTVSLSATAHDPNAGDTLSYTWSAPSGAFVAPTQASTSWTAPTAEGPVTLSLSVSDSRGAALTVSLTVVVAVGRGAEEVKVGFNTAPRLVSLTSAQSYLDVGRTTELGVSASDADGDALSYQWSATCAGTFPEGTTVPLTTFKPSALPTAACNNCQLTVTVKDGRGGQNTGSVALCITRDTTPRAPPAITRTYQSSATAKAGQQLTFELEASDPAGLALTFAWTASGGTLGTPTTGSTQSRITWTAPTCLPSGTSASLTATVTNAAGQATSRSFTVTGLTACVLGWSSTDRMRDARSGHTATLLSDGRVLASAGLNTTAELYSPSAGFWSRTGSLNYSRFKHTATLLPNGKVLVTGGYSGADYLPTAELYDPSTGTWSRTGSLATARGWHTATLLATGQVLVAGGYNSSGTVAKAELYDPATGAWSATGSMTTGHQEHTATRLANGKVLVAGGLTNSTLTVAELYDPATGTWSTAGAMTTRREWPTATRLPTGKVLATGGGASGTSFKTAELYDPATNTWSAISSLAEARRLHTAILLPDGRVLVSGGNGADGGALATAELYYAGP